jgi:hypothetical protein
MNAAAKQAIEQKYGRQPEEDRLKARCRLLQSWYRVAVLKECQCGPSQKGREPVGSTLVDGELTGSNFITPAALAYARLKVVEKEQNPDLTIGEHRLFNVMLSSQPMCFNLFSDLRLGVQCKLANAHAVVASMFAECAMHEIDEICVEMIPRPTSDYINDKTAFDAAVVYRDLAGRRGLVTVETKYTDDLGEDRAADETLKHDIATQLFTPAGRDHYRERGFDQMARNLLLTHAYASKQHFDTAAHFVVGLEEDEAAVAAVEQVRSRLSEPHEDFVRFLPLQELVKRGRAPARDYYSFVLAQFEKRYLDFSPVSPATKLL